MFLGFINTKTNNKYKLLSLSNLPLLFYQSLLFLGKNVPNTHTHIVGTPFLKGAADRTFQKLSHLRVSKVLLEKGNKPGKED